MGSVVPAIPRHAAAVALRLRAASATTLREAGVMPLRALCHAIRETPSPHAWLEHGKAVAIGGVAGAPLGFEGIAWVAFTDEAAHHPHALIRQFMPIFAMEKRMRVRLMTVVDPLDAMAIRFVEWCGFRAEGESERVGFMRYAWERE